MQEQDCRERRVRVGRGECVLICFAAAADVPGLVETGGCVRRIHQSARTETRTASAADVCLAVEGVHGVGRALGSGGIREVR